MGHLMTAQTASPLNYEDVTSIVGPLDQDLVARIIATGATSADVLEAFTWFNSEDALGPDPRHHASGVVASVYAILVSAQDDDGDRRD